MTKISVSSQQSAVHKTADLKSVSSQQSRFNFELVTADQIQSAVSSQTCRLLLRLDLSGTAPRLPKNSRLSWVRRISMTLTTSRHGPESSSTSIRGTLPAEVSRLKSSPRNCVAF